MSIRNTSARVTVMSSAAVLIAACGIAFGIRSLPASAGLLGCGDTTADFSGTTFYGIRDISAVISSPTFTVTLNSDGTDSWANGDSGTWSVSASDLKFSDTSTQFSYTSSIRACDTTLGTGKVGFVGGTIAGAGSGVAGTFTMYQP
jgi:hypothetical protein